MGSLSKLSEKCKACTKVKDCNHKHMEAVAVAKIPKFAEGGIVRKGSLFTQEPIPDELIGDSVHTSNEYEAIMNEFKNTANQIEADAANGIEINIGLDSFRILMKSI